MKEKIFGNLSAILFHHGQKFNKKMREDKKLMSKSVLHWSASSRIFLTLILISIMNILVFLVT